MAGLGVKRKAPNLDRASEKSDANIEALFGIHSAIQNHHNLAAFGTLLPPRLILIVRVIAAKPPNMMVVPAIHATVFGRFHCNNDRAWSLSLPITKRLDYLTF